MVAFRQFVRQAASKIRRAKIEMGRTRDLTRSGIRIDFKSDAITVTDLRNAGKRGKMVDELVVLFMRGYFQGDAGWMDQLAKLLESASSYQDAKRIAEAFRDEHVDRNISIYEKSVKGVTVAPASVGPLTYTNGKVEITAEPRHFVISDLLDRQNLLRAIEVKVTDAKKFYAWLPQNLMKIQDLGFHQIINLMARAGINARSYASMD